MSLARVRMACLGEDVSALGFGCASLGSRVSAGAGLAALELAYDAGISWFDVAPSYGDGQAERLLGAFLKGRRHRVQVLTKVGIAPPTPSLGQRLARPVMRAALAAAPSLRATIRSRRPAATKLPLDAAMIPASLDASLRRLGTDHVDVLALHDATPEEAARADVIAALGEALKSGKARAVAIASSRHAAAAGAAASPAYGLAQMANNPFQPATAPEGVDLVTHSALGADGGIDRLADLIQRDRGLAARFSALGYGGSPTRIAIDYLTDFAFATNRSGVVLMSMFKAEHLASNIARFGQPRRADAIFTLAATICQESIR